MAAQTGGRLCARSCRRLGKAVQEDPKRSQAGGSNAFHREQGMIQYPESAERDHDHGKTEGGGEIAHRFRTGQRRLPTPYPFHDRAGKLPQQGPHPRCDFLEIQRPALFFCGNRWSRWTAKEKWIDCRKRHFGSRPRLQTESIVLRACRNGLEADGPPT